MPYYIHPCQIYQIGNCPEISFIDPRFIPFSCRLTALHYLIVNSIRVVSLQKEPVIDQYIRQIVMESEVKAAELSIPLQRNILRYKKLLNKDR